MTWMRKAEAAVFFGKTERTINRWIGDGRIRTIWDHGHVLLDVDSLKPPPPAVALPVPVEFADLDHCRPALRNSLVELRHHRQELQRRRQALRRHQDEMWVTLAHAARLRAEGAELVAAGGAR